MLFYNLKVLNEYNCKRSLSSNRAKLIEQCWSDLKISKRFTVWFPLRKYFVYDYETCISQSAGV